MQRIWYIKEETKFPHPEPIYPAQLCLFLSPLFFWLISTLFPFPSHKKHLYIGYIYNDNEEMAHKGRGHLYMLVTLYVLNRRTTVAMPGILRNLGETQRHTKKVFGGALALALSCYCSAIVAEPAEPQDASFGGSTCVYVVFRRRSPCLPATVLYDVSQCKIVNGCRSQSLSEPKLDNVEASVAATIVLILKKFALP